MTRYSALAALAAPAAAGYKQELYALDWVFVCGPPGRAWAPQAQATLVPADARHHGEGGVWALEGAVCAKGSGGRGSLQGHQEEGRRWDPAGVRRALKTVSLGLGTVASFCKENKIKARHARFPADRSLRSNVNFIISL